MKATLATSSSSSPSPALTRLLQLKTPSVNQPSSLCFVNTKPQISASVASLRLRPKADANRSIVQNLKSISKTAILIGAAVSMVGKFSQVPAKAESPTATVEEALQETGEEEQQKTVPGGGQPSPLSEFLESNNEAVEALRSLLQQKLENGEDEEALKILKRLVSTQPEVTEWKFLMARLLNEMGQTEDARKGFEEILARNPLSFEALFENALLMDRSGEGDAVIRRLEEALAIAEEEKKVKEARDVRLIMAQIQFLQKNVEGSLRSYEELTREDPNDFRPYFCRGMIYSLLDRNEEAREQFAKYRELSPRKFEVEGYLRTPLSRMKLFGTKEGN